MNAEGTKRIGVLALSFGEPESPTKDEVVPFLEKIFYRNAPLERFADEESRRARSRELAEKRAPGLIADYQKIGGSPLAEQARSNAHGLSDELQRRGYDAAVYVAMQFTRPSVAEAMQSARDAGVDQIVALPMYPLCGYSTTVAALDDVREAAASLAWEVPIAEISGWHGHPAYENIRADNIQRTARQQGVDLQGEDTVLYFSAHGTPIKYLEAGSRYDGYVQEHCSRIADTLGADHTIGYQNHSNRGIAWTEPSNEDNLPRVKAGTVVVEPISFIHEQSETLSELDIDFREDVESAGMKFVRVPVPRSDSRLITYFADLVASILGTSGAPVALHSCRCRPLPGTLCTNGSRDVDCLYSRHSDGAAGARG